MKSSIKSLIFSSSLVLLSHSAVHAQKIPHEISVSAEAFATLEPDTALITLQYESEGQSASQANNRSTAARQLLLKALSDGKFSSNFKTRAKQVRGPNNGAVKPGAIIYNKDIISIELQSLKNVEKVIDIALESGFSVLNIDYNVSGQNQLKNELLLNATAKAQKKARLIARKLGVTLGDLLSAGVSEETQGAFILQARHVGASALGYDEKPMKVFVSLRYAITPAS